MRTRWLMMSGALLVLLLVLGFVLSVLKPPVPVAILRVEDSNGRPVAGATITPDGLRPKQGGGHYGWRGTPVPVQTDAEGFARVEYPYYTDEKLETGEISFAVDHPDYCADRPFRTVASSPPANASIKEKLKYLGLRALRQVQSRPEPVVLKRGGVVRLTGYIGSKENLLTNLHAEISHEWPAGTNFWRRSGALLWSTKVVEGQNFMRAIGFTREGQIMFGDVLVFEARAGETNEFECELKPGVRVAGRLDDSVPRPVRNGRVCIREFMTGQNGNSPAPEWIAWRPVAEDGSFVFESLPEGHVEMIGLCDGFVAKNAPSSGGSSSHRLPQVYEVAGREQKIVLLMEPAAVCEFSVLDDTGRPLAGASVAFWPNVLWGGNGSTIYGQDLINMDDYYRNGSQVDWAAVRRKTDRDFHGTTDGRGVARVVNLPPGQQSYRVSHTNFDMPISGLGSSARRSASITLSSGETGQVVVTMQKKGAEVLTHGRK